MLKLLLFLEKYIITCSHINYRLEELQRYLLHVFVDHVVFVTCESGEDRSKSNLFITISATDTKKTAALNTGTGRLQLRIGR